ncbi:MAG: DUF3822 family protein [Prevotella sp.]|jgi:hypothetical protein|nr:DUF3822 family protein [Prevotella sp.]
MFLPENIDLGQSEKYILTIRIKTNGFMFSISDPNAGKSFCLRETTFSANDNYPDNIQRTIFDLNFLTQQFRQTNVIFVSKDYDLVPASYFDTKEKEDLYNFTHVEKVGHLSSGLIENQDIISLFNIEQTVFGFLSRNLWTPQFYHHANLLINLFGKRGGNENGSRMHLNFHDEFMDIICFSNGKLLHCLSYENEPVNNQLYFILKLWEQYEFDQLKDYLYISGNAGKFIISRLHDYIKNIEFANAPSEIYFWSDDAQKAPLDLLSLIL